MLASVGLLFVYMCMQPVFGALSDRIGRRNNMLLFGSIGALMTVPILTALQSVTNPIAAFALITLALAVVSFYTSISGIVKAEMFPTEVRATASGFCYHQAVWGGLVAPILTYFAINWHLGFAIPMLIGTMVGAASFALSLLFGPETKGKVMVADLAVT